MKVMDILHDSVVDGVGLRTVVFFAGCPHFCAGCHNAKAWNIENGIEMTVEEIMAEIESNSLTDVTLSGGDPFFQAAEVKVLAQRIKVIGKNLWIYTGYTLAEINESGDKDMLELLSYADVLVDGKFVEAERDITLPFRGSGNQKIIFLNH